MNNKTILLVLVAIVVSCYCGYYFGYKSGSSENNIIIDTTYIELPDTVKVLDNNSDSIKKIIKKIIETHYVEVQKVDSLGDSDVVLQWYELCADTTSIKW